MMALIGKNIEHAAQLLKEGNVVAIPTETVYGLAGNALDTRAITKIFETKRRPFFDPLIVHLPSWDAVNLYTKSIGLIVKKLLHTIPQGPLTVLLEKTSLIPDLVTSGSPRVALRVPGHVMALELLNHLDFPLAAPSANLFGKTSPTQAFHVNRQLGDSLDYILDGGPCAVGVESTILAELDGRIVVYRLGGITLERISEIIGDGVEVLLANKNETTLPGTLQHHYAPERNMILYDDRKALLSALAQRKDERVGLICFGQFDLPEGVNIKVFNLSDGENLTAAAAHYFDTLYQINAWKPDVILAEKVPDVGLGRAINDRLMRGSMQTA